MQQRHMKAGEFKTHCLKVMDQVNKTHSRVVITKRNVPIAQLVPIESVDVEIFGKLKGSVTCLGDLIAPIDEVWDADY